MKQVTVRQVRERCIEEAKLRSRERGVAMNTVLVEALEKGLGLDHEKATNGLERFAGDSDFGPEWDSHLEELRQVNPEDWK
ncbi:MAG: hypothetical protein ABIT37_12185 [Luteolibacter sp.]